MKRRVAKSRPVLLDGSFIAAVLNPDDPQHHDAVAAYEVLIDRYENGDDSLFAISTVLRQYPRDVRTGILAPIATVWIARQHRNAAAKVIASSPEQAMTLLMLRRERFRAIATATHDFDMFAIDVIRCAADIGGMTNTGLGPDVEQIPEESSGSKLN